MYEHGGDIQLKKSDLNVNKTKIAVPVSIFILYRH